MLETSIRELKIKREGGKNDDAHVDKRLERPAFIKTQDPKKNGYAHARAYAVN